MPGPGSRVWAPEVPSAQRANKRAALLPGRQRAASFGEKTLLLGAPATSSRQVIGRPSPSAPAERHPSLTGGEALEGLYRHKVCSRTRGERPCRQVPVASRSATARGPSFQDGRPGRWGQGPPGWGGGWGPPPRAPMHLQTRPGRLRHERPAALASGEERPCGGHGASGRTGGPAPGPKPHVETDRRTSTDDRDEAGGDVLSPPGLPRAPPGSPPELLSASLHLPRFLTSPLSSLLSLSSSANEITL